MDGIPEETLKRKSTRDYQPFRYTHLSALCLHTRMHGKWLRMLDSLVFRQSPTVVLLHLVANCATLNEGCELDVHVLMTLGMFNQALSMGHGVVVQGIE